jgi:hypothetical protein
MVCQVGGRNRSMAACEPDAGAVPAASTECKYVGRYSHLPTV